LEYPREKSTGIQCPSCGQVSESSDRCSHCGMRVEKKWGAVFRRIAMLAVGVLVLISIQFYFSHRQAPLVRIDEISTWMNFSTVRVRGVLVSDARKLRSGTVLYRVDDGSGALSAFLTRPSLKKLPKAGSRVILEGSLSIGAGQNRRMRVFSEDQVVVEPPKIIKKLEGDLLLSDVEVEQEGERLTVYGRVDRVWNPESGSKAPHRITLADASGRLDVVHWFGLPERVAIGDTLKITGQVGLYRGNVQLKVFRSSDIAFATDR
jgi:DNA/RNA endonuclease YhcR with UshA esterase domain